MINKLIYPNDSVTPVDLLFCDDFWDNFFNWGGYQGLADLLAKKLNTSILIEDEFFHVLARANFNKNTFACAHKKEDKKYLKPQLVDPRIIKYVHQVQNSRQPIELPELLDYGITKPRKIFPLVVENNIKGYLHVFTTKLDLNQLLIIYRALRCIVILIYQGYAQDKLKDEMRRTLIHSLIQEQETDNFIQWEKGILGLDLCRQMILAVIQIKKSLGKRKIEDVLCSITSDLDINTNVIAINDEQAVLLLQSTDGKILKSEVINQYIQYIFEALKITFAEYKVKIGVGRECYYPRDYRISFAEACNVISFTDPQPGVEEGVFYYHSLRLIEILPQPGSDQTLSEFVQRIIGKLYEYSLEHNTNLIETLECYFDQNCCIQNVARELFIHASTVRYRLEKAEKITCLNLKDKDARLEIQLALKLYRYYGETLLKC